MRPALGEQGVHGVHDVRPAQQPGLVSSRTTGGGSQWPPRTASVSSRRTVLGVGQLGHRVGQRARHRRDRASR